MTIPTWPSDLNQRVQVTGFSSGFRDGRLLTKMDRGPDKMRRLTSAAARPVACAMYGTFDDCARLERFWTEDLVNGTLPFLFPSQLLDGVAIDDATGLTLLDPSGVVLLASYWDLVVFAGGAAPVITPLSGTYFNQQFTLNVMP